MNRKNILRIIVAWAPAVLWMAVIFILSSRSRIPLTHSEAEAFAVFKSLHLIEYAFLFTLLYRAVRMTVDVSPPVVPRMAWILTVLYAASDEFHQTFTPTREGRPRDVIIDAVGALLAWLAIRKLLPILHGIPRTLARLSELE